MDTNLSEVFKEMLESQIKKSESEIQNEKESTLLGIECMMEGAVDKIELASLNKQYDVAEKQFEQEILNQRNKIIKEYMSAMEKLMKQFQKVYCQELKNKNFKKEIRI
jgi:hypothetical protein